MSLVVQGVPHDFLVDTGATKSSISAREYNGPVTNTCEKSVGITGVPISCPRTPPLEVYPNDSPSNRFVYAFRIIPNSPVNLLGRDLMAKMQMSVNIDCKGGLHVDTPWDSVPLLYAADPEPALTKQLYLDKLSLQTLENVFEYASHPDKVVTQAFYRPWITDHVEKEMWKAPVNAVVLTPDTVYVQTPEHLWTWKYGRNIVKDPKVIPVQLEPDAFTHASHVTNDVPEALDELKQSLWATGFNDPGFISCTPYKATLKPGAKPVYIKQYPLSKEKEQGIAPVIKDLLSKKVIRRTLSPYNTPINPVPKPGGTEYRFTQDLRAVNALVQPLAPIVPDVNAILTAIPSTATCFTVIDLCSAFFSIPVHPDTQPLFGFTYLGNQYTFNRLPMGFIDSPAAYSAVVRKTLESWTPPEGSTLIQYVDDLLLCSVDEQTCKTDSLHLLQHLGDAGHKVTLRKMQFCLPQVTYLGFLLSAGKRLLSPERVKALMVIPRPQTKTAMLSFLVTGQHEPEQIHWTQALDKAYNTLKQALCSAPALGLPNYNLPFHLYCTERGGTAAGVLAQEHGNGYRAVAFYSKLLPTVVQGMPACLRATAACAMMVEAAQTLVLSHSLILHTSHQVLQVLNNLTTQHMTAQRRSGYETILTSTANLTIKYIAPTGGPAPLLHALISKCPLEHPEDHNCIDTVHTETSPRLDLQTTPLEEGEVVFVDGSCSKPADGVYLTGFAVVQLPDTVVTAGSLPFVSAQAAELVALAQACRAFAMKDVTIYTDSRYAFGVVHDFGVIWQNRGFVAADGKSISHSTLVQELLDAIKLPHKLAIVKCKGHSTDSTDVRLGNDFADTIAKEAAFRGPPHPDYLSTTTQEQLHMVMIPALASDVDVAHLQFGATETDLQTWISAGLTKGQDGLWSDEEGRVGIPQIAAPLFISHFHGFGHISKQQTKNLMTSKYVIKDLLRMIDRQLDRCLTCARNNPGGLVHGKLEHLPPPDGPMQVLQIDFTHMPTARGGYKYLLVIVDQFSKWVEAFPTTQENARTVAKILCKEIIPRFGCPLQINSDRGTPFTSQITQMICTMLSIDWKFHIPYHPQSSGQVERMNRTIKDKFRKGTGGTFTNWLEHLPAVLAEIRMTPSTTTGYSPFEILMGRPFPTPWCKQKGSPVVRGDINVVREEYVTNLIETLNGIYGDVSSTLPQPTGIPTHPFKPGDTVLVKQLHKNKSLDPPFGLPTTVIAVTRTAVLTEEAPVWIHANRIKRAPDDVNPGRSMIPSSIE
ncbi:uncharacterized protein LOC128664361 [Bombina bombina]|uniref:uncharacterized protein LOC128664361 n=1 Tax=Bombina bombina TaxID=8345 RepID=UPI00235AFB5B|nr:uncharacterized protein LOC128664361 [Bombina bombina]